MTRFLIARFTKKDRNRRRIVQALGVMGSALKEMGSVWLRTYRKPKLTVQTVDMLCIGIDMSFAKPKRYVSKSNLNLVRKLPCLICGMTPVDVDHWVTRGAGGGDNLSNLMALCRRHHIEKGAIGVRTFYRRYESIIKESRQEYNLPPLVHRTEDA